MKKLFQPLHRRLFATSAALIAVGMIYAFADSEGVRAATSPSKFILLAGCIMLVLGLFVQEGYRERQLGPRVERPNRTTTEEIPSPRPSVAKTRIEGDGKVVIVPAFDFRRDPDLDRPPRPDRHPLLDGFVDREQHREFFGSLAVSRHHEAVR